MFAASLVPGLEQPGSKKLKEVRSRLKDDLLPWSMSISSAPQSEGSSDLARGILSSDPSFGALRMCCMRSDANTYHPRCTCVHARLCTPSPTATVYKEHTCVHASQCSLSPTASMYMKTHVRTLHNGRTVHCRRGGSERAGEWKWACPPGFLDMKSPTRLRASSCARFAFLALTDARLTRLMTTVITLAPILARTCHASGRVHT